MFPEAATHLPQHKKYQLHIFFQKQSFTISAQNVLKIFHNLSMIMKNIFDGQCNSLGAGYQNNDKKLIKNCKNAIRAGAASNIIITESAWKFLGSST